MTYLTVQWSIVALDHLYADCGIAWIVAELAYLTVRLRERKAEQFPTIDGENIINRRHRK